MAERPQSDPDAPAGSTEPEIELVLKKRFREDRLLPQEIELVGSLLPELVREIIQMDEGES